MMLRRTRQAMAEGRLSPEAWLTHVHHVQEARNVARQGFILYLKHSGERIVDLRTLPTEELHEWYLHVRQQVEKRNEALKMQTERQRLEQDRQRAMQRRGG